MATHVAFLHDEPLDEIVAGRKRFEFRLSFRRLACRSVRQGDVLLLKRVGGEVEAACDIGEVRFYRKLPPEEVAALARTSTGKGTPVDAQNVVNRHFKPLLRRAGLPDIRWHDLRHTYATLLLARGTHPTLVQKSLGHASVQLTLDRYSHWMPSMGRNTASAIDAAIDGTTEPRSPREALTTKEAGA